MADATYFPDGVDSINKESRLLKMVKNPKNQRRVGSTVLERVFLLVLSKIQRLLLRGHKETSEVRLISRMQKERISMLTAYECYTVLSCAKGSRNRPGAFLEVGVYQGGSAKLVCEMKGSNKPFYVCDTFEGLPESAEADKGVHRKSQYSCSLESVSAYLSAYENVHFVKGFFPDSAEGVIPEDIQFAFVHLDVDLYESTLKSLEYVFPRLISGGIILSHDYSLLAGVKSAFHEFLETHPGCTLIELPSTQCMLIKS
jgi:hypothetical protein